MKNNQPDLVHAARISMFGLIAIFYVGAGYSFGVASSDLYSDVHPKTKTDKPISTAMMCPDDEIPPLVLVKEIIVELDNFGQVSIDPMDVDNGSTDNCGIVDATLSKTVFSCADLGENALTYIVYDAAGNSSAEEAIVQVVDKVAPVVNITDMTVSLDESGWVVLDAAILGASSTDNCGNLSFQLSQTQFDCVNVGIELVVLTVVDGSGNENSKEFELTIVDDLAPSVEFIPDVVLYLGQNGLAFPGYDNMVLSSNENCGIETYSFDVLSFNCNDIGMRTMEFSMTDINGNISITPASVSVIDTIKPKFNMNQIEITLNAEGNAFLSVDDLIPFATDNCGISGISVQNEVYTCEQVGPNQTEIIITDNNDNFFQKSISVIVVDPFDPIVSVENIVVELDENGEAFLTLDALTHSVSDNCAVSDVSLSQSVFTCADIPGAEAFLIVTDTYGNEVSEMFTVTVMDKIAPEINCASNIFRCEGPMQIGNPVIATDNCGFALSQTTGPVSGTYLNPGNYDIMYVATDASGNEALCRISLNVFGIPNVDLGEDMQAGIGSTVTLVAGSGSAYNYLWSTGETTPSIDVLVTEDITISVQVGIGTDCGDEDEIFIEALNTVDTQNKYGENLMRCYPNPSSGVVNISFTPEVNHTNSVLTLMDVNGRLIKVQNINQLVNDRVLEMDLSDIPNGVYVLGFKSDQAVTSAKIVKQ